MQGKLGRLFTIALLATSFVTGQAMAQSSNGEDNFFGDRITLSVDVPAKLRDAPTTSVCIPARTTMLVIGQSETSLTVKLDGTKDQDDCDKTKPKLSAQVAFDVARTSIKNSGPSRTGATYGALVVPFKYQLKGNKDFTGSAAVAGYAGFRFESLKAVGFTLTPIGFIGASNISVPKADASSSDNIMGFTYGFGLVGTFKSAFQSGIVVGWDRVGKNAGYQYNGKPWIAVEIGYAFLQ